MSRKQYYQENSTKYIDESLKFSMDPFYKFVEPYVVDLNKEATVLDIGFGSTRDMSYYRNHYGFDVTGVDSCENFVTIAKDEGFNAIQATLPEFSIDKEFDLIYSIGMIFHINDEDRAQLFKVIAEHLKKTGHLVLSYNDLDRTSDKEREFFKVTRELIDQQALNAGLKKVDEVIIEDKRTFSWITSSYTLK